MRPTTIDRRRALGLLAAGTYAVARPDAARAGRGWCRVDPIVQVGGQLLHLWVALWARDMAEARRLANGPIAVDFVLPPLVPFARLDNSPGFGEGFVVTRQTDPTLASGAGLIPVRVRVRVPTRRPRNRPVEVWLQALDAEPLVQARTLNAGRVDGGRAYGRANAWFELRTPEEPGMASSPRP